MMASRAHRLARRLSSAAASYDALVIGGGMTAVDAAVQAKLLGALNVTLWEPEHRGQEVMIFGGIIDILQKYTIRKHIETDINIVTKGLEKYKECSCVSPDAYRDRFLKFITHIF